MLFSLTFTFSEHMKNMLHNYGNETFGIDATHNITKYSALKLFVLSVRTNCDYQVS